MAEYEKIPHLFTRAESAFLRVLEKAAAGRYVVYGKVRIADVLRPVHEEGTPEWRACFNRIQAKHFDFILCDKDSRAIVAAVELNDSSHQMPQRMERGRFVEQVCRESRLPLIFIEWQRHYDWMDVRERIQAEVLRCRPLFGSPAADRPAPERTRTRPSRAGARPGSRRTKSRTKQRTARKRGCFTRILLVLALLAAGGLLLHVFAPQVTGGLWRKVQAMRDKPPATRLVPAPGTKQRIGQ